MDEDGNDKDVADLMAADKEDEVGMDLRSC